MISRIARCSSVYVFDAEVLRSALGRIGRDNAQGEVYLTDVLAIARADGGAVRAVRSDDPLLVEGVNDRAQLAVLGAELNRRVLADWMIAGVTVIDPLAALLIAGIAAKEGLALWRGEECACHTIPGLDTTSDNCCQDDRCHE